MKASHSAIARVLLLTSALLAAGCVPAPDSTPAPSPSPVQTAPAPTSSPTPVATTEPKHESWMDAPRTPGDWSYSEVSGGTIANYGVTEAGPRFSIGCMTNSRRVVLIRHEISGEPPSVFSIMTETANRTLPAKRAKEADAISQTLDPRDPLLDAMALTKGRFAVETPDSPTLYLPAWAEVTRVIEDCR